MLLKDIDHYYHNVYRSIKTCQRCSLHSTCLRRVPGSDNITSKYWLIGEAPGGDEDIYGAPFVGRAGKVLNNMLIDAGLSRDMFYISNIVKCRPPNNRVPSDTEIYNCTWLLRKEIFTLRPSVIISMGNTATQGLLTFYVKYHDNVPSITTARSIVYTQKPGINPPIPMPDIIIPVYHPSYCLRNKMAYATTVNDLRGIGRFMKTGSTSELRRRTRWLFD